VRLIRTDMNNVLKVEVVARRSLLSGMMSQARGERSAWRGVVRRHTVAVVGAEAIAQCVSIRWRAITKLRQILAKGWHS